MNGNATLLEQAAAGDQYILSGRSDHDRLRMLSEIHDTETRKLLRIRPLLFNFGVWRRVEAAQKEGKSGRPSGHKLVKTISTSHGLKGSREDRRSVRAC